MVFPSYPRRMERTSTQGVIRRVLIHEPLDFVLHPSSKLYSLVCALPVIPADRWLEFTPLGDYTRRIGKGLYAPTAGPEATFDNFFNCRCSDLRTTLLAA